MLGVQVAGHPDRTALALTKTTEIFAWGTNEFVHLGFGNWADIVHGARVLHVDRIVIQYENIIHFINQRIMFDDPNSNK